MTLNLCRVIALVLLFSYAVTAAPVGPVTPAKDSFRLGIELARDERDYLRTQNRSFERGAHSQNVLVRAVVGVTDRIEVSMIVGGSTIDLNDLLSANSADNRSGQATIGVAAGAILSRNFVQPWDIPIDLAGYANYIGHHSHTRSIGGTENADADFDEWSAGLQLQAHFRGYLPYLGAKYSLAEYSIPGGFDAEGRDHFGLVIGTGFDINRWWSGYVETRLIDETSVGGGVFYKF